MTQESTVFIVDDDAHIRKSFSFLLQAAGYHVKAFPNGSAFLDEFNGTSPGCLLLDERMPGMTGMELQRIINERNWGIPVIFVTGHGDVALAVAAMKQGALDFLEKPIDRDSLLKCICIALKQDGHEKHKRDNKKVLDAQLQRLTARERQIMALVVSGMLSKQIARALEISERTVEVHRKNIMEKMGVDSLAALVVLAVRCGMCPEQYTFSNN